MPATLGLGIIGLGVQGRRMLARLGEHERIRAVAAWDPDPGRLEGAGLGIAPGPAELVGFPGVDCVYVASPPASHLEHAQHAFDAGLPVFCEKPLAVDFDAGRRAIERIGKEGLRGAVNFSLASSPGMAAVLAALAEDELGALRSIEIEVAFREWPRPWQAGAGRWLAERGQGGFTREVLSHFVFVLQRALQKARVEKSVVTYPKDGIGSEDRLSARLLCGGVPVSIEGSVGGEAPDFNRFALAGERATLEFRDWMSTRRRNGAPEAGVAAADSKPPYLRQLDQLAAFIDGKPHGLPDFAEALAVQETIEALLAGGRTRT